MKEAQYSFTMFVISNMLDISCFNMPRFILVVGSLEYTRQQCVKRDVIAEIGRG